jgi:putative ABC transport system permease protein
MGALRQTLLVTALTLRGTPQRFGTSLVILTGVAGVVAVLISVLALGVGIQHTYTATGRADRVIVLRDGTTSEKGSYLSVDAILAVENAAGVRKIDGKPIAAGEALTTLRVLTPDHRVSDELMIRGVRPNVRALRPEMRLVAGRMPRPGLREIIVGRALLGHANGLRIGRTIEFRDSAWQIVGVFSCGSDAHESEVWGDLETVRSAYHFRSYMAATVLLEDAGSFAAFADSVLSNPSIEATVLRETTYNESRAGSMSRVLFVIGYVIGGIMTVGAFFAAVNTMYSVISARVLEIATLRAIGFGAGSVMVAVMSEALALSLLGGILGASVAWVAFDGTAATTYHDGTEFSFPVTIDLAGIVLGLVWGCAIGLAGGLIAAIRAARISVASALRST